jgi:hypothetical protein
MCFDSEVLIDLLSIFFLTYYSEISILLTFLGKYLLTEYKVSPTLLGVNISDQICQLGRAVISAEV